MTSRVLRFRHMVLAITLIGGACCAVAGPGVPIPLPPTVPHPNPTLNLAGPGVPIPLPPTVPHPNPTLNVAGPGVPIPLPPTVPHPAMG